MRSWVRILVCLATLSGAVASIGPSAVADEDMEICVDVLQPLFEIVDDDGPFMEAIPIFIGCFPSHPEAARAAAAAGSPYRIGEEFLDVDYVHSIKEYWTSAGCENHGWGVSYVGNQWNDLFSSGIGYSGCDANYKYMHSGYGAPARTCLPNCRNYQSLAREVSSLKWLP